MVEKIRELYLPINNGIFKNELALDIMVPLLFLRFKEDTYPIDERVTIKKMTDLTNLSKAKVKEYSPNIVEPLISSASHTLILENYTVQNDNYWSLNELLRTKDAFPVDQIELFFAAVKIITNYDSGYAQLLSKPINWRLGYNGGLEQIYGTSTRGYPHYFDDFHWKESAPEISEQELMKIAVLYKAMLDDTHNSVKIATRKLLNSIQRENEEDAILDVTMALEALLTQGEKDEISHKLALRISALLSNFIDEYNSLNVYKEMKNIYSYRSSVIHGSKRVDKNRFLKNTDGKSIPTINKATEYLSKVLEVLLMNPRYLESKLIDEELLLKKI